MYLYLVCYNKNIFNLFGIKYAKLLSVMVYVLDDS